MTIILLCGRFEALMMGTMRQNFTNVSEETTVSIFMAGSSKVLVMIYQTTQL
jgi:hypothetical protein